MAHEVEDLWPVNDLKCSLPGQLRVCILYSGHHYILLTAIDLSNTRQINMSIMDLPSCVIYGRTIPVRPEVASSSHPATNLIWPSVLQVFNNPHRRWLKLEGVQLNLGSNAEKIVFTLVSDSSNDQGRHSGQGTQILRIKEGIKLTRAPAAI
ncbi:hypothetical protein BT63DRAFT_426427 [Microthyrium microscopicum]|uniref:Uncharacterized protein n=1 Tax=Microthyrium microscopicum TaxID=703497 RepID=A0A6A6U8E1_9PEZI|nr:hypothetical protein BT63DRAFT_426427 [Microthyrium microscopicum]